MDNACIFADLSSFVFFFFDRLSLPLWRALALRMSSRMWKTLPAVALRVASQSLSNTKETFLKRQSTPLIRTPQSEQAVAPQARVILNLWTNQSCNAVWSTSSSFSPASLPYTLSQGRWTKSRVTEAKWHNQGSWFQRAPRMVIMQRFARALGGSRKSALLPSRLPANSSLNAPVSPSTSQRGISSLHPDRKNCLVGAVYVNKCTNGCIQLYIIVNKNKESLLTRIHVKSLTCFLSLLHPCREWAGPAPAVAPDADGCLLPGQWLQPAMCSHIPPHGPSWAYPVCCHGYCWKCGIWRQLRVHPAHESKPGSSGCSHQAAAHSGNPKAHCWQDRLLQGRDLVPDCSGTIWLFFLYFF